MTEREIRIEKFSVEANGDLGWYVTEARDDEFLVIAGPYETEAAAKDAEIETLMDAIWEGER